ncbi:hypothetical protein [Lentzea sp. NPDC060358]|uniref:hypothetical protein n=1 Tax=Lentzea sp. NPDC060358 TaxID=3347103 RepID=UPI0036501EBE
MTSDPAEAAVAVTDLATKVCGTQRDLGIERRFRDARAAAAIEPAVGTPLDSAEIRPRGSWLDGGVHYSEVEQAVRDLVAGADDEKRHRFGAETVVLLTTRDDLADAAEAEFDEDARRAFEQACADPAGSTPESLRAWLGTIDEGTLSDGDMEPQVLWALEALEHWAGFLADRDPELVVQLAIRSLESVDFEVSAPLGDFLSSPEMAAEFDRITRHLG